MSTAMNPAAPHFVPSFITAPGETDPLLVGAVVFLVILLLVLGSTYFWLHSLPERIAHGAGKIQFQLVAVMSLLALFTHNNAFWIGALLLALIPIPDFWTPLANMADSLARMAGRRLHNATQDDQPVIALDAVAASASAPANVTPLSLASLKQADASGGEVGNGISAVPGEEAPVLIVATGSDQLRALSKEGHKP